MSDDFDVIVVGAGMAGCSAAIRLARNGANVLLVERSPDAGAKNLSGGVLWGRDLDRVLPGWSEEMPLERHVVRKRFGFLTKGGEVSFDFEDPAWRNPPYTGFTVLRARTDAWLTQQAEKAGATVVTGVPVERINWEGRRAHGIVQEGATMTAPITILADGANSRLSLGTPIRPDTRLTRESTELGVKETYRLSEAEIEKRFNLGSGEGHAEEWVGGIFPPGVMGGGFLYTNRDTISLGIIVNIASMYGQATPSHELVEQYRLHPAIQSRVKDAELVEYGAKLISSGWASRPTAFHGDGWLVVGDAAGFVFSNGLTIQGMNYAVRTGVEAAETALQAQAAHDASAARLADYDRRLKDTGIIDDFRDFEGLDRVKWNPRLYSVYPEMLVALFHALIAEEGRPKRHVRDILLETLRKSKVSWTKLAKDGVDMARHM